MPSIQEIPPAATSLLSLIRLRALVGYLGGKNHANWWDCGFMDTTGLRFLETTFPRTAFVAAVRSTAEAARVLHDSRIGRVGSFHLFRLPAEIEEQLDSRLSGINVREQATEIASKETALAALTSMTDIHLTAPAGPVRVGTERKILSRSSIAELAAHYHSAFTQGIQCFPYFAAETNVQR